MRKQHLKALEQYLNDVNKAIFDLDEEYLKNNGYSTIFKPEAETQILENPYYIYEECLKINPQPVQRFKVFAETISPTGSVILIHVTDFKHNITQNKHFNWRPIKHEKRYIPPSKIQEWINNTLVNMRLEDKECL